MKKSSLKQPTTGNQFSALGVKHLAKVLEGNRAIVELDLAGIFISK
jgi:hypothetical protein